jgi:hypothetical protein
MKEMPGAQARKLAGVLMEDMLRARFTGTGKKSRCPTRIIGGTFLAFVGNSTDGESQLRGTVRT